MYKSFQTALPHPGTIAGARIAVTREIRQGLNHFGPLFVGRVEVMFALPKYSK